MGWGAIAAGAIGGAVWGAHDVKKKKAAAAAAAKPSDPAGWPFKAPHADMQARARGAVNPDGGVKPAAVAPHMNQQQFAGKAKGFGDIKSKLSHQFGGATAQPPAPSTPTQRPPSGRPDSYKRKT